MRKRFETIRADERRPDQLQPIETVGALRHRTGVIWICRFLDDFRSINGLGKEDGSAGQSIFCGKRAHEKAAVGRANFVGNEISHDQEKTKRARPFARRKIATALATVANNQRDEPDGCDRQVNRKRDVTRRERIRRPVTHATERGEDSAADGMQSKPDPREEPATPASNRLRQQDDWKSKAPREQTIRQTERARGGERRAENKFPRCPDSIGADNDKRRYQKQRWKKGREP